MFSRQIESRDEEIVFSTDITFVCVDNNGAKKPIEPAPVSHKEQEK